MFRNPDEEELENGKAGSEAAAEAAGNDEGTDGNGSPVAAGDQRNDD